MSQKASATNSPLPRSKKTYNNLNTVVAKPGQYDSTVGIILDCTGDYKTDDSYDYVTKIKIIDSTITPPMESSQRRKDT